MVVLTPLDIPKLEPDSWDVFWDLWNKHATHLTHNVENIAAGQQPNRIYNDHHCRGMDIFVRNENSSTRTRFSAGFVDIKDKLPKMYNQLQNLPFANHCNLIRLIDLPYTVRPHTDAGDCKWIVRNVFYYSGDNPWFITSPAKNDKKYLKLPIETNWFALDDVNCWHGAKYTPESITIIAQVFLQTLDFHNYVPLIQKSADKFKDYIIRLP